MPEYTDGLYRRRRVPAATLRAVLEALDTCEDEHGADVRFAPPVAASFEPATIRIQLRRGVIGAHGLEWRLAGEGREMSGRIPAEEFERRGHAPALVLPALEPGYYRLVFAASGRSSETLLVRAPARAWLPEGSHRDWGLAVQLYELVGPHSVGIGDFGDLAGLAEAAGNMGAAVLGINPLHALFLSAPERASPYSPNSRLALNPLYLDIRRLPGFKDTMRERTAASHDAPLNEGALIDYPALAREKLALARAAYGGYRDAGGDAAFTRYRREADRSLAAWARYEAIAAGHGADWRAWPTALCNPASAAVARFAAAHAEEIAFYLWLQWQSEVQLGAAARAARAAGMRIGLYRDLALGADPAGAEAWAGQGDFVAGLAIGAPSDRLNPRGQNWGFPPLHPARLLNHGLTHFVEVIRANMRCAGALRIDHVLGLNRLFIIPSGADADAGVYLRYPLQAMLAVIALESQRARCMVIGEDLGTVPRGLRPKLARRGILSQRLLYFEHDAAGGPRAPEDYPALALAAVGTHDLAPLTGWWHGDDLARMDRLKLWPNEALRAAMFAARPATRAALRKAFVQAELPGAEAEVPTAAVYRWLARTPSRLLTIQPEDAFGLSEPVNVPGTAAQEPNWRRRRLPPWPEWTGDPRFEAVCEAVRVERGAAGKPASDVPAQ